MRTSITKYFLLLLVAISVTSCIPNLIVYSIKEYEKQLAQSNTYTDSLKTATGGSYTPDYITNSDVLDINQAESQEALMAAYREQIRQAQYRAYGDSSVRAKMYERQIEAIIFPTHRSSNITDSDLELPEDVTLAKKENPFTLNIINIDNSNYPEKIDVFCNVRDFSGRYISGLAPPYSQGDWKEHWTAVVDSCHEEFDIKDFTVKEVRSITSPIYNITFLLDHSPSMGFKRVMRLQEAVDKALDSLKETDWVSIIKYSGENYVEVMPTNDKAEARENFIRDSVGGNWRYEGGTMTYLALDSSISVMRQAPDSLKKIIILFTDGASGDKSKKNVDKVFSKIKSDSVKIFTIAYGAAEIKPMKELADYTGGKFYHVFSTQEFPYVFKDILANLNNYYQLTYTPPNDYGRHKADISVNIFKNDDKSNVSGFGYYDCSLFGVYVPIGTKVFMNIEFATGSAEIEPISYEQLEQVAKELKEKHNLKIEIAGHTDDVGTEEANLQLSEKRALAVKNALLEMGLSGSRLKTKGYGESMPLVPNDTDANKKKNRRTEFIVKDN